MRGAPILAIALTAAGCSQIFGLDPPVHDDAGCQWRSLSAGYGHTCGADPAGDVWCWGGNWENQASPGNPEVRILVPARIALPGPAVQVAAGKENSCARLEDGSAWCWGKNTTGQLGNGTTAYTETVVRVSLSEPLDDISVGAAHACGRRASDGTLLCWGDNQFSQLGTTELGPVLTPTVVPGTTGATAMSAGHRHTCAVVGRSVLCWGRNQRAQASGTGAVVSSPQIVPLTTTITQLSAAGGHTCALDDTGGVYCWGAGENGQLGINEEVTRPTPTSPAIDDAAEIHAQNFGTCARTKTGRVKCWGNVAFGDGTTGTSLVPVEIPLANVTAMTTGNYHACAVSAGTLYCWGSNASDQLGRGKVSQSATPTATSPLPAPADAVYGGSFYACARASGQLYCWGSNGYGTFGDGTTLNSDAPELASLGLSTVAGAALGHLHMCAWGGGVAKCVGANYHGQIGNGEAKQRQLAPFTLNLSNVTDMAAGVAHTCAIAGNSIRCWGHNNVGQLGIGSQTDSYMPAVVTAGPGMPNRIVAGWEHTCALANGTVRCWGDNSYGQLGDSTTAMRPVPVTISLPAPAVDLAAGKHHTCALLDNGEMWCWGQNASGELGQNDRTNRMAPVKVPLSAPVVDMSLGDRGSCARLSTTTGGVYCWGWGYGGELGNGAFGESLTPVELTSLATATDIARGPGGGCAIVVGEVRCWGDDTFLGDGDTSIAMTAPSIAQCSKD